MKKEYVKIKTVRMARLWLRDLGYGSYPLFCFKNTLIAVHCLRSDAPTLLGMLREAGFPASY